MIVDRTGEATAVIPPRFVFEHLSGKPNDPRDKPAGLGKGIAALP